MKDWIQTYDRTDILLHDVPSETVHAAASSGVVVTSTLPRCVQPAQWLSQSKAFLREEIFCEAALPHPHWHFPKLPLSIWGVVFRLAWFCGFSCNAESFEQATARVCSAAQRLTELAKNNGTVFLVGHGIMTMLIAKHLIAWGWAGPKRPVNKYWQFSAYHAPV